MSKSRFYYIITFFLLIALGLFSRSQWFPEGFVKEYVGDCIWAAMVYFGFSMIFPQIKKTFRLYFALLFSFGIEFLQLYKAPWINAIRSTTIGGLILGFDFVWTDLVCYSIGILAAYGLDKKFWKAG